MEARLLAQKKPGAHTQHKSTTVDNSAWDTIMLSPPLRHIGSPEVVDVYPQDSLSRWVGLPGAGIRELESQSEARSADLSACPSQRCPRLGRPLGRRTVPLCSDSESAVGDSAERSRGSLPASADDE